MTQVALFQNLIDQGVAYHQHNQLDEAIRCYSEAIDINPTADVAICMLGTIALQIGEFDRAVELLESAIGFNPTNPDYYLNYCLALDGLGRRDLARTAIEKAIELKPRFAAALSQLGMFQEQAGELEAARKSLSKATRLEPKLAEPWINLSSVLGQLDETRDGIRAAKKALICAPDHPQARSNLGRLLLDTGAFAEAQEQFENAVSVAPDFADAWSNLSRAHLEQRRPVEAEAAACRALEINPDLVGALCNLGLALARQTRYDEAAPLLERAVALDPDEGVGVSNLACVYLALGDFKRAWPHYARMLETKVGRDVALPNDANLPPWDGKTGDGKRVLLVAEQGIGEQVLFSSLLPEAAETGAHLTYACDHRFAPMIKRSLPGIDAIALRDGQHVPIDYDFYLPIGSLAAVYRNDISDFSRQDAFLVPDPEQTAMLRERYRQLGKGPVIGISWRSASAVVGINKNVPLELWGPVFDLPNATFVSIQYGKVKDELATLEAETGVKVHVDQDIDALKSIEGNASQVAACDLIISISNAALHLAGACGVRTLALIGCDPNWYWSLGEDRNPWYPSVSQYRQTAEGNWDAAIEALVHDAREFLKSES